jgi:hypothetical protein
MKEILWKPSTLKSEDVLEGSFSTLWLAEKFFRGYSPILGSNHQLRISYPSDIVSECFICLKSKEFSLIRFYLEYFVPSMNIND